MNFDRVADLNKFEKFFGLRTPHANTTVRGGLADGVRLISAVDAVNRAAQSDPSRPERIVAARPDDLSAVVPRRSNKLVGDVEIARRAGCAWLADRDVINFHRAAIFNQSQLPVGKTDEENPVG